MSLAVATAPVEAPLFRAKLPRIEEHFRQLPPRFYTLQPPEGVTSDGAMVHWNRAVAALLGLPPDAHHDPAFAGVLAGRGVVEGFSSLATVYAGHQFGHFVPQLGDGRALLIAQLRNEAGALHEIQLKGAGRTPYSRFADGRAVMRSSIREYLCSEAMAGLGIPTTRALSLVATRRPVRREIIEPGAIVARVAPSHIRFGHFEFFAHRGDTEAVKILADHVIDEHVPALSGRPDRYSMFLEAVVLRTADLLAHWQAVGFAHGVMNTDNMSILGLTIDYGPFGFVEPYDPNFICNHSDDFGRYAFGAQPGIALWNLNALAFALRSLIAGDDAAASLKGFEPRFLSTLLALMRTKLGLSVPHPGDGALVDALLRAMAAGRADMTLVFRRLADAVDADGREPWLRLFGEARAEAEIWLDHWHRRLAEEPLDKERRRAAMLRTNPKFILRNWVAETVIRAVEDEGDVALLDDMVQVLHHPFDEHPEMERFAAPPPEAMKHLEVSCSS